MNEDTIVVLKKIDKRLKKLHKNKQFNDQLADANSKLQKLNNLENQMLGPNSKAYKEAKSKYLLTNKGGDSEYGFDHYVWGRSESGNDYKKALSLYQSKSKDYKKNYDDSIDKIVNRIVGKRNIDRDLARAEAQQAVAFGLSRYDKTQSNRRKTKRKF